MNERVQFGAAPVQSESRAADSFAQSAARLRTQRPLRNRRLRQSSTDLQAGRVDSAEKALRQFLAAHPNDPDAMMLMAKVAARRGRPSEALEVLKRCLELAPDFVMARFEYAKLLTRSHDYPVALGETEQLLADDTRNPHFRQLKAMILAAIGEDEQALAIYRQLAEENPQRPESWIRYGDALRVTGSADNSIAAYRHAITCRPSFGAAWWSLANLKTFRFDSNDIGAIQEQLAKPDVGSEDRVNLLFALGKAYEDQSAYDRSYACYAKGNAARRLSVEDDSELLQSRVQEKKEVFTHDFFEARKGVGCRQSGPIFVLGRPRSGSTLVEQILCGHSAIEGTAELPYLTDFATRIMERECPAYGVAYPEIFTRLPPAALTALGEEYMERTQIHRKTDRPFFIDKAPANYHHIGMIELILPNAKIVDARRHPVATGFSMFKHNYTGTNFRLAEHGLVYRDYVALMAHYDRVLPGRIHRVIYEELVLDPEAEVRRLLDYLALPFEESCLRFYESGRSVRTPSSEQVRRPITREAVEHWRKFEPWLAPLIESLGAVFTEYPRVPDERR